MSLTLSLYRDILKKARLFDKQPILKVRITPPAFTQIFEAKAEERQNPPRDPYYYYTPHTFGGKSFYQTFKELFKEAIRTQNPAALSNAFAAIRDFNDTIAVATNKDSTKKTQPLSLKSEDNKREKIPTEFLVVLSPSDKKKPLNEIFRSEMMKLVEELDKVLKKNKALNAEVLKEKEELEKNLGQLEEELLEGKPKAIEGQTGASEVKEIEKEAEKETEKEEKEEKEGEKEAIVDITKGTNLWVKPSDQIGIGTFLISHPTHDRHRHDNRSLDCFYRSTVMITGVTQKLVYGLILNKPLFPEEAKEKYHIFASQHKDYKKLGIASMPAALEKANWFFGGPGDIHPPQNFSLTFPTFSALHSSPQIPDAKPLLDGLYCGGSMLKLMNLVEAGEADLSKIRLFVGGATWAPGQLRDEINKGWWIQGEASADFIFGNYPNSFERHWEDALTLMGGEYLNFVQAAQIMGHPRNFDFDKSRVPYCTLKMLNVDIDK